MNTVPELTAQLKASVEVIGDAIRSQVTKDSYSVVADLFSEMIAVRSALQAEISHRTDQVGYEDAFNALQLAEDIEPKFNLWASDLPSGSLKKKKSKDAISASPDFDFPDIDWDAFPVPVSSASNALAPAPSASSPPALAALPATPAPRTFPAAAAPAAPSSPHALDGVPMSPTRRAWPLKGTLKIALSWPDIGPLLVDDPQASEESRRKRLEDFFISSLASSCNLEPSRIKAHITSTSSL